MMKSKIRAAPPGAPPSGSHTRLLAGPEDAAASDHTLDSFRPTLVGGVPARVTGLGNSARGGASGRRGFRPPSPLLPRVTAAGRRKEPRTSQSCVGERESWRPWRSRSRGTGAGPCGPRCHPPPSSPRCSRCWYPGPVCSCCSSPWRPRVSRCDPRPCATGKVSRAGPGPGCQSFFLRSRQALGSGLPEPTPPHLRPPHSPHLEDQPHIPRLCAEPHLGHPCNPSLPRCVPVPVAIVLVKAPISIRSN